jgi:hypothetical protein
MNEEQLGGLLGRNQCRKTISVATNISAVKNKFSEK